MAKPTQSESGLSLDRRQLLASSAALSIGTVPAVVAVEVSKPGQAVTVVEIARSQTAAWNVCAGTTP